jgi:hypothetical protein
MPPLKILTLASLLALAIAAPPTLAQSGHNSPPPARSAPAASPATPGDAMAAPAGQRRTHTKKRTAHRNRGTDATKTAPAPAAPATTPN